MFHLRSTTGGLSRPGVCRVALVLSMLVVGCSSLTGPRAVDNDAAAPAPVHNGPGKYHLRESQFVFYSDFPLKASLPLFQELSEMREQIYRDLHLPESNTVIQVFLFEDQTKYETYMKARYAELPIRRAFFIKQPRGNGGSDELFVFTWWGEHIRQDLRHELTHGILHSVLKDVPLWLDEGFAEVYELPPETNGYNAGHMDLIRKGTFQPDLAKLEQLNEVKQMLRPEYREAWAWVHFMLRGKPESRKVLLSYLQQLRQPAPMPLLLPKLKEAFPVPADALIDHLNQLDTVRNSAAHFPSR